MVSLGLKELVERRKCVNDEKKDKVRITEWGGDERWMGR